MRKRLDCYVNVHCVTSWPWSCAKNMMSLRRPITRCWQWNEPIRTQSRYLQPSPSAGRCLWANHITSVLTSSFDQPTMWRELFICALKTAKKKFYALAKIILPVNGELTNSSFRVEKAFIFCTAQKTMYLEEMLNSSVSSLEDTKSYVNQLQAQTALEKKERAR